MFRKGVKSNILYKSMRFYNCLNNSVMTDKSKNRIPKSNTHLNYTIIRVIYRPTVYCMVLKHVFKYSKCFTYINIVKKARNYEFR